MVAPSISYMAIHDFKDKICFGIRLTKSGLNISPQHWGLGPLKLAPVELNFPKVFLHHFALTNPIISSETKGCTITVPALSAQGPGNFLRELLTQLREQKGSAAGIQGTNNGNALMGSSCVTDATSESKRGSHLGGLGSLILPAEGDKGISGEGGRS